MTIPEVQSSQQIELSSLLDLLRLLASRMMMQRNGNGYLYYSEHEGKHVYFITQSVGGWYKYRGLPVTTKVTTDVPPETNFIEYISPTSGNQEEYKFVKAIKQATTSATIPIIKIDTLPVFMMG